ncbi:hypothetical protein HBI76_136980 [Parastagonospora nodorum]|nr:hypothetical protein HBI76_136980 [Parastagonospora nodorum]
MLQTNVREGYRITTLEVVKLIEDLISYLAVAKCTQLQNAQIPKVFYKAASSSIVSNRSTALITDKFGVALLTKPAILNDANVALVDAVHYSVIDALMITLIKDDDDLLGTVNSYIKLRRLRAVMLLCQTMKLLGNSNKDRPPLKRRKTKAADSRYAKASRRRTKKDKDLEDSDTSSDVLRLRRRDRAAACARLAKRKRLLDSDDYCSDSSLDINSKDNSEDEEATTAKNLAREQKKRLKALLNAKTRDSLSARTEVQNAQAEGDAIEYNAVNDDDKLCSTKGKRTFYCADPLALQFYFFSDSPPENISRLTKEKAIEMRIDTTNAISKALAAANKLTIPEANTPAVHSKATKHCLALLAAQFVIVCSFGKVDKHVFRAYNTISVTAYCLCLDFLSIVQNAEQQCRDILEKEGLNELEASRRVIFNRFKMQAIASYSALATLKAAQFKTYSSCKVKRFTLNSVKDLFTNLSKDYFLSIAAEDAAKAANTLLPLKEVRAKILIESYKLIVQAVTWLGLREKFSDESILVMQRGITQHEINLKLAK